MGIQREPRMVANPGLECWLRSATGKIGPLPVVNVSPSGLALTPDDRIPAVGEASELLLSHRSDGDGDPIVVRGSVVRQSLGEAVVGLSLQQPLTRRQIQRIAGLNRRAYRSEVNRWGSEHFLEQLAQAGDFQADAFVEQLTMEGIVAANAALEQVDPDSPEIPGEAREPLRAFFRETGELPPGICREDLELGREVFLENALPIAVVLFLKVLPTGYCAPALTRALAISGNTEERPVRRAFLVLQMIIRMTGKHAFDNSHTGAAVAAQKLRLLHAGVRKIIVRQTGDYQECFGKPINQEQMLTTIMAFSYETIKGLRQLDIGLTAREERAFYYFWRIYGQLMGIHPEGEPASTHHIPLEFPEAEAFQKAFRERHFKSAADNPQGVAITAASLRKLGDRLAGSAPWIPFVRHLPRWLVQFFLSRADLKRLDVKWSPWAWLPTVFVLALIRLWRRGWALVDRTHHGRKLHHLLAGWLLKQIVQGEFGEVPKVSIPKDLESLRSLVDLEVGRKQGRRSSD